MGRTNGVTPMITTTDQQRTIELPPLSRAPGATLWAFLVGIMVGVALGVLR